MALFADLLWSSLRAWRSSHRIFDLQIEWEVPFWGAPFKIAPRLHKPWMRCSWRNSLSLSWLGLGNDLCWVKSKSFPHWTFRDTILWMKNAAQTNTFWAYLLCFPKSSRYQIKKTNCCLSVRIEKDKIVFRTATQKAPRGNFLDILQFFET